MKTDKNRNIQLFENFSNEDEKSLRIKIANEIERDLEIVLENCACLGRDAYGSYIDKCKDAILNKIKKVNN